MADDKWPPIQRGLYLSCGPHKTAPDKKIAVISDGHPSNDEPVFVLAVAVVDDEDEAKRWYEEQKRTMLPEPQVIFGGQVEDAMLADPELAKAMKDFSAQMRQAMADFRDGKYASLEDAIEALTGQRPEMLSDEESDETKKRAEEYEERAAVAAKRPN